MSRSLAVSATILALVLVVSSPAAAVTYTWSQTANGTSNWSASGNWSGATIPATLTDPANVISIYADRTHDYAGHTLANLPASAAIVSNNDLGACTLNSLVLTETGPSYSAASLGSSASVTLTGSDLNFVANGTVNPTVMMNAVWGGSSGTVFPYAGALSYTINNNVSLGADTTFKSSDTAFQNNNYADLTIGGTVSGAGGLIVCTGIAHPQGYYITSTLTLSGTLSYQGNTTIQSGVLALDGSANLPATTNLVFDARLFYNLLPPGFANAMQSSALLATSGTFTRSLGTGPNQVQFTTGTNGGNGGGFAATDSKLTVTLNNDAATPLVWGSSAAGAVPGTAAFLDDTSRAHTLYLNAMDSAAEVEVTNAINLNKATGVSTRSIYVNHNPNNGTNYATLSGIISNDGSAQGAGLLKNGPGTLFLTNPNNSYGANSTTYGSTVITGGAVDVGEITTTAQGRLPSGSYLSINGGVLQGSGTFARTLSTTAGNGKFAWASAGGFAARGGKLTVNIPDFSAGTGATPLVWASTPGFNPSALLLGSVTADNQVVFASDIDLNTGSVVTARTLKAEINPFNSNAYATIAGIIKDSGSALAGSVLKKSDNSGLDNGLLELTGANTYTVPTQIWRGTLQAQEGVGLPTASRLMLAGGYSAGNHDILWGALFQSTGTFTRSLGTAAGNVEWNKNVTGTASAASGGFASGWTYNPDGSKNYQKLTVNIGGNAMPDKLYWHGGTTATWSTTGGNFVAGGYWLAFNSTTSRNEVEFRNPIDLNNGTRTIYVGNNPVATGDYATLSGNISSVTAGNGHLVKTGDGVLRMTGLVSGQTYTGSTTINLGTLVVNGSTALQGAYSVTAGRPQPGIGHGAILGGTGTIGLKSNVGITLTGQDNIDFAAINPGDYEGVSSTAKFGTLTIQFNSDNIASKLTFGAYSRLLMDVDATANLADKLVFIGTSYAGGNIVKTAATDALYINLSNPSSVLRTYTLVDGMNTAFAFDNVFFNGTPVTNLTRFGSDATGYFSLVTTSSQIALQQLTAPVSAVRGDANNDGKVDFADYLILESTYGSKPVPPFNADFDNSGVVDFADYLALEANYGFGTAVPEPTILSLLGVGVLALIRRRR